MNIKPLGHKSYGHIPHFLGSQVGPGDHTACPGQVEIATVKARDKHDLVIVQVKLDGSNVSAAKHQGQIIALTRAGYLASESNYKQHRIFAKWVKIHEKLFDQLLNEGERICGEWLLQAHGTLYDLTSPRIRSPFVAFDIMKKHKRLINEVVEQRILVVDWKHEVIGVPPKLHHGGPAKFFEWNAAIGDDIPCRYGELEEPEGFVYRVERKGEVDFLIKYVRPGHQVGKYLPREEGQVEVWNKCGDIGVKYDIE